VSVEQAASHLAVSTDSVYRWIAHRGLPAHRVGRVWRFKRGELDAWVRAGEADDKAGSRDGGGAWMFEQAFKNIDDVLRK